MTFRSQIEPSIKSYECFMILRHIQLFEYTLSQFCSRFTLLLELEWPNSWDSKIGDFCEETVLPMCDFWPGCVEYLTHCLLQLPLAPLHRGWTAKCYFGSTLSQPKTGRTQPRGTMSCREPRFSAARGLPRVLVQ